MSKSSKVTKVKGPIDELDKELNEFNDEEWDEERFKARMDKVSIATEKLGTLLLKGWTMLAEHCQICSTPLMSLRGGEPICPVCNPVDKPRQSKKTIILNQKQNVIKSNITKNSQSKSLNSIDEEKKQNLYQIGNDVVGINGPHSSNTKQNENNNDLDNDYHQHLPHHGNGHPHHEKPYGHPKCHRYDQGPQHPHHHGQGPKPHGHPKCPRYEQEAPYGHPRCPRFDHYGHGPPPHHEIYGFGHKQDDQMRRVMGDLVKTVLDRMSGINARMSSNNLNNNANNLQNDIQELNSLMQFLTNLRTFKNQMKH